MNSVLRADQVVMETDFVSEDKGRRQWVTAQGYRSGILIVSGALLSSPCTLETNEVALPLFSGVPIIQDRYALMLDLQGCGDGGGITSTTSVAGRNSMMVVHSTLLTAVEGGLLPPEQPMVGTGRTVLYGGANRLTYYLSEAQQQMLVVQQASDWKHGKANVNTWDNNALLRLRLDYE